jgi:hypothetical protein
LHTGEKANLDNLPTFPDPSSPDLLRATVTAWAQLTLVSKESDILTECVNRRYLILESLWQAVLVDHATTLLVDKAQALETFTVDDCSLFASVSVYANWSIVVITTIGQLIFSSPLSRTMKIGR